MDQSRLDKLNVHLIQIGEFLPQGEELFDLINKRDFLEKRRSKIIEHLDKIYFSSNATDLVVIPELVVPNSMIEELRNYAKNTCYIVCGMIYTERYHNKCAIIDPTGTVTYQYKCEIAPMEPREIHRAHRYLDNQIHVFINTNIGDFAVLICYDFVNTNIMNIVRGKIDHLIILSMNHAADTFLTNAEANSFNYYTHIFLCNVAAAGKSAICGPFKSEGILGQLSKGEAKLELEINLKEFIEATTKPDAYFMKPDRIYKAIPAGYVRSKVFPQPVPTPEDCIRSLYPILNKNKEETIKSIIEIEINVDRDIAELDRCLHRYHTRNSSRTKMRLNYILQNTLEKVCYLHFMKIYANTRGFYVTERFFGDISDDKYIFVDRDAFLKRYNLNLDEIKEKLNSVARYCRQSCIGYGAETTRCNVLSLKILDNVFLITCREKDKSKIQCKDITVVAPKKEIIEGKKQRLVFEYTNYDDDPKIKPSKETYLNYNIYYSIPHINAMLHFHHDSILTLAWKIPFLYRYEDNPIIFKYSDGIVPSIKGRNVNIKGFSNKVIKELNKGIRTIIGTRHGAWTFGSTLSDCLNQADNADKEAGSLNEIHERYEDDKAPDEIEETNENLYNKILDIWKNYEKYDTKICQDISKLTDQENPMEPYDSS